jgi:hypothetical protein
MRTIARSLVVLFLTIPVPATHALRAQTLSAHPGLQRTNSIPAPHSLRAGKMQTALR